MTDYHYHFYSYAECVFKKNSKPEKMYAYLRTYIEPALPNVMPNFERMRQMSEAERERRLPGCEEVNKVSGLYCLYRGDTLLAAAEIMSNAIDRIMTIPAHRRQGHATRLITEIKDRMILCGVPAVYSPVAPHAASLYERAGWVKINGRVGKDGTTGYCPAEVLNTWNTNMGAVVDYDSRKWLLHLLFLQLHNFKPKDQQVDGMMDSLQKMVEHRINNS
jgi:GNAT superfamily N-acetyltransferase